MIYPVNENSNIFILYFSIIFAHMKVIFFIINWIAYNILFFGRLFILTPCMTYVTIISGHFLVSVNVCHRKAKLLCNFIAFLSVWMCKMSWLCGCVYLNTKITTNWSRHLRDLCIQTCHLNATIIPSIFDYKTSLLINLTILVNREC